MSKNNVACKNYKYFLIRFASGQELICSSYKEFIELITPKVEVQP